MPQVISRFQDIPDLAGLPLSAGSVYVRKSTNDGWIAPVSPTPVIVPVTGGSGTTSDPYLGIETFNYQSNTQYVLHRDAVYQISDTINVLSENTTIDGNGATILAAVGSSHWGDAVPMMFVGIPSPGQFGLVNQNITLKNFRLNAQGQTGICLSTRYCSWSQFYDLRLDNATITCLDLFFQIISSFHNIRCNINLTQSLIDDMPFRTLNGLYLHGGDSLTFYDCSFDQMMDYGVLIDYVTIVDQGTTEDSPGVMIAFIGGSSQYAGQNLPVAGQATQNHDGDPVKGWGVYIRGDINNNLHQPNYIYLERLDFESNALNGSPPAFPGIGSTYAKEIFCDGANVHISNTWPVAGIWHFGPNSYNCVCTNCNHSFIVQDSTYVLLDINSGGVTSMSGTYPGNISKINGGNVPPFNSLAGPLILNQLSGTGTLDIRSESGSATFKNSSSTNTDQTPAVSQNSIGITTINSGNGNGTLIRANGGGNIHLQPDNGSQEINYGATYLGANDFVKSCRTDANSFYYLEDFQGKGLYLSSRINYIYANGVKGVVLGGGYLNILDGTIANSATDGFVWFPSMTGTPTGVPTNHTGEIPLIFDRTAGKLWARVGGAWKSVTFA
jgi:hypothetical protein